MHSSKPAAPHSPLQRADWLQNAIRGIRLPLGLASLIGLFLALAAHAATIAGVDVEAGFPMIWLLHYGIFPILLLSIAATSVMMGPQRRFRDLVGRIPTFARLLIVAAVLYAIANFVLFIPTSGMGAPIIKDGKFYFNDHGIVREVTEAQFHAQRSILLRSYSGHWIYLYLVPAVILLTWTRRPLHP